MQSRQTYVEIFPACDLWCKSIEEQTHALKTMAQRFDVLCFVSGVANTVPNINMCVILRFFEKQDVITDGLVLYPYPGVEKDKYSITTCRGSERAFFR